MFLKIETITEKILVGKSLSMSLKENKTFELWQSFMQNRHQIKNALDSNLYSIQVYSKFEKFSPTTVFTKWAAIEIKNKEEVPIGMDLFLLPKGTYAVFIHKGLTSDFPTTMNYIFQEWLPSSKYEIDNRPHFEILGEKYKNNNPLSEEEVWIPIRKC